MCPLRHLMLIQPGLSCVCQCSGIRHRLPSGILSEILSRSGDEKSSVALFGAGSLKVLNCVVFVRFMIVYLCSVRKRAGPGRDW